MAVYGRAVHGEIGERRLRHGVENGRHDVECFRSLYLQHPGIGIGDGDIKTTGVGLEPGQELAIGKDIPETVPAKVHQDAVHQDAALVVAGDSVCGAALAQFRDITAEHPGEEGRRLRTRYLDGVFRYIKQSHAPSEVPIVGNRIIRCAESVETAAVDPHEDVIGEVGRTPRGQGESLRADLHRVM